MIVERDMSKLVIDDRYKTVVFLIRHGESIGNACGEFLGHTDKDLSELGYIQARRTAEFLSSERVDAVYSSDLIRAHNTVAPHAKMRGISVIDSVKLREIYAGEWDGLNYRQIKEGYSDAYIEGWRANFGTFTLPGGESVQAAGKRFHDEVLRIASENVGKRVIIGAHAAVIRSFWGKISGTLPEELAEKIQFPNNASVSLVYFDGNRLLPGEYSHDAHVRDLYKTV